MMPTTHLHWLLACLLVLWPCVSRAAAPAQPAEPGTAVLKGLVVDARSGAPIPGALVRVRGTGFETITDADGRFVLEGLPPGRVVVQALMLGYAIHEREVDLTDAAAMSSPVTLVLAEAPPAYDEEVTVRGDAFARPDLSAPSQIAIGSADLGQLRGVLADDPFRAVQAMPGVTSGDDFRAEFSIRGSGPAQVGVLLDGVPAGVLLHTVQGQGDTGSVSMIHGDLLGEVIVTAGSPAAVAGNRIGGQVDLLTRDPARDRPRARVVAGLAVASLTAEGPFGPSGRGAWLVAGRGSYAGWLARRLDPSFRTAFVFADLNAKLTWDVTPSHHLSLVAIAGRMSAEQREPATRVNAFDEGLNESAFLLFSSSWRPASRLVVTQQVSGSYNRFQNRNPLGDELGRGRLVGGSYRARASWLPSDRWTWRFGANADRDHHELRLLRRSTRPPLVTVTDGVDASGTLGGGFAEVSAVPRPTVTWTAGGRLDASTQSSRAVASAWGHATWAVANGWQIRAGTGRYGQSPSLLQTKGRRGGGTLPPAEAFHADLVIEQRLGSFTRWQIAAFGRWETNGPRLPDAEPRLVGGRLVAGSTTTPWQARLDTEAHGVEVLVQRRAPSGVSGWMAYGFGRVHVLDVMSGERFPGDFEQRHQVNAFLAWRPGHRVGASVRWRYGSGLPVVGYYRRVEDDEGLPQYVPDAERNRARFPPYQRLDVRVDRAWVRGNRRVIGFVEIVNLLGHANFGPYGPGEAEKLFPFVPAVGMLVEW